MGHSSVVVTERYAHLRPDLFREEDYRVLVVSLVAKPKKQRRAAVRARVDAGAIGYNLATSAKKGRSRNELTTGNN